MPLYTNSPYFAENKKILTQTPYLENNDATNHLLNINPKIIINQPEDDIFILAIMY